MGYDLQIVRKSPANSSPITEEEWFGVVRDDPEMRLDGYVQVVTPDGATIRIDDETFATWEVNGTEHGLLRMSEGRIISISPSSICRKKMWRIAQLLGATVHGDDGERYNQDGEISDLRTLTMLPRPWWRFW